MNRSTTPWLFIGITIGLFATAVLIPVTVFPYAETTPDPDAIEAVAWFIAIGVLFLAFLFVPITIAVWMYQRNQLR